MRYLDIVAIAVSITATGLAGGISAARFDMAFEALGIAAGATEVEGVDDALGVAAVEGVVADLLVASTFWSY